MTALKAGALILVIKTIMLTGDVHLSLSGDAISYDRGKRLVIMQQPSAKSLEQFYFQANPPKTIDLPPGYSHWGTINCPLNGSGTMSLCTQFQTEGGAGPVYLEDVGQGLYRKMRILERPGFTVRVGSVPTHETPWRAGPPRISMSYLEFTGGKYDPSLGVYVDRPTVVRKEVSLSPPLEAGQSMLLVWWPSTERDLGVDLPEGMSLSTAKPPAGAEKPRPGDGGTLPRAITDEPVKDVARRSGPFTPPPPHPRLVVYLEVITREELQKRKAAAGKGAPPPATNIEQLAAHDLTVPWPRINANTNIWPLSPAAMQDREYLEAQLKVLDAMVADARIRASGAKQKLDVAEAQQKAGLVTAQDCKMKQFESKLAQYNYDHLKTEAEAQRVLIRHALEKLPAESVRVVAVGEVNQPGVYVLPLDSTIQDLLAKAGGPTDGADPAHAQLLRTAPGGSPIRELDLTGGRSQSQGTQLEGGDVLLLPSKRPAEPLKPGDTLYLPARPAHK